MTEQASVEAREFAPCPTCKQYSHSIGEDRLAAAFMHFQTMFSHRGDGFPTQFVFDEQTRDAAQVLMAAARSRPSPADVEVVARAIYEAEPIPPGMEAICSWEVQSQYEEVRELLLARARAAITAMPTTDKAAEERAIERDM